MVPGSVIGVITSVIVESGTTVTKEIITGESLTGPITLAPATTTYASSEATSAVSSVSSQLVAIVPIILAWKKDPIPQLKTDALDKVTGTKGVVMGLIASLGTKPSSSPCGSKKKRFSLPIIGDIVNALTCIEGELDKVTSKISGGVVGGVDAIVSTIESKLDELENKEEEDKTKSQSDGSTSTESSKSSESSCTSTQTAFQVTILCEPTVYTTMGTAVSTTTCSSTTVTTTGCTATGSTTTISSSTSAPAAPTQCGADTCGDSCKLPRPSGDGKPLSTTAFDCKTFPTVTVSDDGAVPTSGSKRELGKLLLPRALPDKEPEAHDPDYVEELADEATILPLAMGNVYTDGGFYPYPAPDTGSHVYGLQALTGCTAVIIASNKGVYVAHIWEVGGFMRPNGNEFATVARTHAEFRDIATNPLRRGGADTDSIRDLVGTDEHPGRLHRTHQPKIFVITPYTTDWDRTYAQPRITTTFRHNDLAHYLRDRLAEVVPGATTEITGYTRNPGRDVEGMVFLEVDREQRWEARSRHSDRQIGMWRVWAGPDLIDSREFRVTHRRRRAHKRALELGSGSKRQAPSADDQDYEGEDGEEVDMDNPCPVGGAGSGANSTSTATGNNTAPAPVTSASASASASVRNNTATLTSLNHTATFTTLTSLNNTATVTSLNHPATSSSRLTAITTSSSRLTANTTSSSGPATTSKTISSPPITSCTLSSVAALSTAYSYYTIDYPATIECACNDGWTAGIANTVGSNGATTYYCEIGSTHIEVSTAPPKTTTKAPAPVTTTSSAPHYVTGTCDLHIFEASESYNAPLYMQFNITDGGNNLLASESFTGKWGEIGTVKAADTKLPYDVTIDFLQSTKVPSRMARDIIVGRISAPPPPVTVRWEDWVLTFTAGSTKWDDTETSGMPYCSVGGWDNGNFWDFLNSVVGGDTNIPVSQLPPRY